MEKEFNLRCPICKSITDNCNCEIPEEFNLSEKIKCCCGMKSIKPHQGEGMHFPDNLDVEDVKEFINLEWYLIQEFMRGDIDEVTFWKRRNKLVGDELNDK